ncbi:hypothetical protein [Trinickia mobilis]|uniref:hypothetical protein n=1 Tax=Trinickia mobilis TaxID=2816356 RepID=UPI001A8F1534|nr:hypothetical protein [Trinickia mobilis]
MEWVPPGFLDKTSPLKFKIPNYLVSIILRKDSYLQYVCHIGSRRSKFVALTNLIGNGVATIAVVRWERATDMQLARAVLEQSAEPSGDPANGDGQQAAEPGAMRSHSR